MKQNYKAILKNTALIKLLDPNCTSFGADRWNYEFRKITETDVAQIELKNNMTLPADFRDFILAVGFGPAPVYGADPKIFLDMQQWDYEEDEEYLQPLFDGYITIAEYGCGVETMLIVKGVHKGELWHNGNEKLEKLQDSYYNWYLKYTENFIKILQK